VLSPTEIRSWATQRLANQRRVWIDGGGLWPLTRGLEPPTGSDIRGGLDAVTRWTSSWATARLPNGVRIRRETFQMRGMGSQTMPGRIEFDSARAVAEFAGGVEGWDRVSARRSMLIQRWPSLGTGAGRIYEWLENATDGDLERLVAVTQWVLDNPCSGLYLRQLPVAGVDTKWIEGGQRRTIAALVRLLRRDSTEAGDAESDFLRLCGLRAPGVKVRIMALDPNLRCVLGGIRDIEAPIEEVASLTWSPRATLFVENLACAYSLPDLESTVAIVKLGHAVSLAARLPWIRSSRVLYWGDIDTDGLKILSAARAIFPSTRSVLMDIPTLLRYRERWVEEGVPNRHADRASLTAAEAQLYDTLLANGWPERDGIHGVRLEQERLDWTHVEAALRAASTDIEQD